MNLGIDSTRDEGKHILSLLTELTVKHGDISSAIVLRCIQDDLVSRVFVIFEDDDCDISQLMPVLDARNMINSKNSCSSAARSKSLLAQMDQDIHAASSLLIQHTIELISMCIDINNSFSNNAVGGVGFDVCCELLERLMVLSEWKRAAYVLGPILLKVITLRHEPLLEGVVRSALNLLCCFAGAQLSGLPILLHYNSIPSPPAGPGGESNSLAFPGTPSTAMPNRSDLGSIHDRGINARVPVSVNGMDVHSQKPFDETIENLISGKLFTGITSIIVAPEQLRFCKTFLQDNSDNEQESQVLHRLLSRLPVIRLSIPPLPTQETKRWAINHAVRATVGALLLHTGSAQDAMELSALLIADGDSKFQFKSSDVNEKLISIWRTAWGVSKSILSTHRKKQFKICVECEAKVIKVEDDSMGKWRCENGHEKGTYNIIDGQSLENVCMQIVERARILVVQPVSSPTKQQKIDPLIEHGKRFIESALTDNISPLHLTRYFRAKNEFCFLREWGFNTFAELLQMLNKRDSDASFFACTLRNLYDFYKSMPKAKEAIGSHPLEYCCPSRYAACVQQAAFSVFQMLALTLEENVQNAQSNHIFEEMKWNDAKLQEHRRQQLYILDILQILRLQNTDNEYISRLKILPRLVNAQDYYSKNDPGLSAAVWVVIVRFFLQIMVSNNQLVSSNENSNTLPTEEHDILNDIKQTIMDLPRSGVWQKDNYGLNDVLVKEYRFLDGLQARVMLNVVFRVRTFVVEMKSNSCSSSEYVRTELECYRWVCMLGAISNSSLNVTLGWLCSDANWGVSSRESRSTDNILLALMECGSPRIQMLALRLCRQLWKPQNNNNDLQERISVAWIVGRIFYLSGSWALKFKNGGKKYIHLAMEAATLLRYLACHNKTWKMVVMEKVRNASYAFLKLRFNTNTAASGLEKEQLAPEFETTVFNFWTSLAIMIEMTSPPTMRVGTRVKYMVPSGDEQIHCDYGILIRVSETSPICAVVLDTQSPRFPTMCNTENIFPVNKASKYRNEPDFFGLLKSAGLEYDWLLDTIECFTSNLDDMSMIGGEINMIWDELQSMVISALHAWLASEPEAVTIISTQRPLIWKYIVDICALTAPAVSSGLVNVSDLDTTEQAAADFRAVCYELEFSFLSEKGVSLFPEKDDDKRFRCNLYRQLSRLLNARIANQNLEEGKESDSHVQDDFGNMLENSEPNPLDLENQLDSPVNGRNGTDKGKKKMKGRRESLLSAPELKSGSRAALARHTSSLVFQDHMSEDECEVDSMEGSEIEFDEIVAENVEEGEPKIDIETRSLSVQSVSSSRSSVLNALDNDKVGDNEIVQEVAKSLPRHGLLGMSSPFTENTEVVVEDPASYATALQVERNHRRAKQERRLRFTQHFRSMSKAPNNAVNSNVAHMLGFEPLSYSDVDMFSSGDGELAGWNEDIKTNVGGMNINGMPETNPNLTLLEGGKSISHLSRWQPETPRGKDAVMSLALPVELPTVDTLGLTTSSDLNTNGDVHPAETGSKSTTVGIGIGSVVNIGSFVKIPAVANRNGCVEDVDEESGMALVRIVNLKTGSERREWFELSNIETMTDVIAARFKWILDEYNDPNHKTWDVLVEGGRYRDNDMAYDVNGSHFDEEEYGNCSSAKMRSFKSKNTNLSIDTKNDETLTLVLFRQLHMMRIRAAILHARRAALSAISASVDKNLPFPMLTPMYTSDIPTISNNPGQIIGMLKLCQSSLSSLTFQMDEIPIWKATKHLFEVDENFADMIIDEGVLLLSIGARDTITFESAHPLCPLDDEELDEDEVGNDNDKEDNEDDDNDVKEMDAEIVSSVLQLQRSGSDAPRLAGEQKHELFRANSFLSLGVSPQGTNADVDENLQNIPVRNRIIRPSRSLSKIEQSENNSYRKRRLSGSHRFHIAGASGLLVEFDKRSSVLESATQVTLSYDPQDREVIKVLGEGCGENSWQPIVVSGDTCYIHWQVDSTLINEAMERARNLGIDEMDKVAWGFGARVRCLDDVTNVDEKCILERPFGWRVLRVLADSPDRIIKRKQPGLRFFSTVVNYLRTSHLAGKAQLCQVLTEIVKAFIRVFDENEKEHSAWKEVIKRGLYKLHYDLLLLFDDVVKEGYVTVSPYFECLLELLVSCRKLWAQYPSIQVMDPEFEIDGLGVDLDSYQVPLCSLVSVGTRESSKIVVNCETCGLTGKDEGVCLACAAHCHRGHVLRSERSTDFPCSCSLRGPSYCASLSPRADIWKIRNSERTWFDVVCQTTDILNRMCSRGKEKDTPSLALPISFVTESFKTCGDGRLLRLCLRSLEECLRSEAQADWWSRDARRRWANALDAGLDTVAEVSFGLVVLESSMLESSFAFWWSSLRKQWHHLVRTNQAWALAQAMLHFQYALHSSSCYPEWDSRQNGWIATLEGISGLAGERVCTYVLSGNFPRPQLFRRCKDCNNMEVCEHCATTKHVSHKLSRDIFSVGFCDEKSSLDLADEIPDAFRHRSRYKRFSKVSKFNFEWLQTCYWEPQKCKTPFQDDQLPTEPKTLSALINIPRIIFVPPKNDTESKLEDNKPRIRKCVLLPLPDSHLLSPRLEGILVELLGVKENTKALVVGCGSDNGFSLALIAVLVHGGQVNTEEFTGVVHGFENVYETNQNLEHNFHILQSEYGISFGKIEVFTGDLVKHNVASKRLKKCNSSTGSSSRNRRDLIPGMLMKYDRIFCSGLCLLSDLEIMSSMLSLDGVLLCPMVTELGYGVYVQRNRFNGQCESRTLAPLFEPGSSFIGEIKSMRKVKLKVDKELVQVQIQGEDGGDGGDGDEKKSGSRFRSPIRLDLNATSLDNQHTDVKTLGLKSKVAESWDIESWAALGELINKIPGRDIGTLSLRDITSTALEAFPKLQSTDLAIVRGRFAVLKRINVSLSEVLPLVHLSPDLGGKYGGIGRLLSSHYPKRLIFLATKLDAWSKMLEPNWSNSPNSVMPGITVSRSLAESNDRDDSLFMQTFYQLQSFPIGTLRRRDQSFRVRFAGEGGHDVGGLYRDLFTEMCTELRESRPSLFFHPQHSKSRGETLLPRPSLNSKMDERLFGFVGLLMGICTLRHGATLSLDINPIVWKSLVKEPLAESSLNDIDEVTAQKVSFIRNSLSGVSGQEELEYVFQDTTFTAWRCDKAADSDESSSGSDRNLYRTSIHELCPFGVQRRVTMENILEYADLLMKFRLKEYEHQINMLRRGIACIVPVRLFPIFTWQELEHLICGVADVDVEVLQNQTKYVGGVQPTDPHIIFFWDVLSNEFTAGDRTQFLKFVWGRERMSSVEEGVNVFQIGPHVRSVNNGNPDMWLPVAHTCFFSLDLPAYSSREITKSKLLFAMNNCNAIDADDDGEGHANMALEVT